ncbi:MAG: RpiB/LacA/LacB family sugar-phosphate isomerase [Bacilli bacterium]
MNIGVASDHRGFKLKERILKYLFEKGNNPIDFGTSSVEPVDYPDYAKLLCEGINNGTIELGIAICGSGIGMSIACNKIKKIRCAKVDSVKDVYLARNDNNANIIAINSEMMFYKVKDIIDEFIKTPFSNIERHIERLDKIEKLEHLRK